MVFIPDTHLTTFSVITSVDYESNPRLPCCKVHVKDQKVIWYQGILVKCLPALPQFIIILQSLRKKSLYVDIVRNERGKGTIRHFRRELWNIVLNAIDVNCSIGYFKLSLKGFLFSFLYKDVCQELLKFDVWDVWFFSINFHIFVFSKDNLFCISVTCLCCLFHTIKMVSFSQ